MKKDESGGCVALIFTVTMTAHVRASPNFLYTHSTFSTKFMELGREKLWSNEEQLHYCLGPHLLLLVLNSSRTISTALDFHFIVFPANYWLNVWTVLTVFRDYVSYILLFCFFFKLNFTILVCCCPHLIFILVGRKSNGPKIKLKFVSQLKYLILSQKHSNFLSIWPIYN